MPAVIQMLDLGTNAAIQIFAWSTPIPTAVVASGRHIKWARQSSSKTPSPEDVVGPAPAGPELLPSDFDAANHAPDHAPAGAAWQQIRICAGNTPMGPCARALRMPAGMWSSQDEAGLASKGMSDLAGLQCRGRCTRLSQLGKLPTAPAVDLIHIKIETRIDVYHYIT